MQQQQQQTQPLLLLLLLLVAQRRSGRKMTVTTLTWRISLWLSLEWIMGGCVLRLGGG
jgi:hypothetical protein